MYNKAFKKEYDKIFNHDPLAANIFLMLVDMADEKGEIYFEGSEDQMNDQINILVNGRFNDVFEYQL